MTKPTRIGQNASVARDADGDTLPERVQTSVEPRFDSHGLICAVAQQFDSGEVLMVAWMDAEALRRTRDTGRATYWSRSRQEYWVKGDVSGNIQTVRDIRIDCDGDAVLLLVDQQGPACHTSTRSCFDDRVLPMDF